MNTAPLEGLGGEATALVLIDLQAGVVAEDFEPYSGREVIGRCLRLVEAVRRTGGLIVYVTSSHLPNGRDRMRVLNDRFPVMQGAPVREPGWDQLDASIAVEDNDVLITKRGFNAFYGSDLDLQLRRHGITQMVLAGATTNFGVEGTARAGADHSYNVIVVEDACTSVRRDMHDFSVNEVLPYFTRVRTTAVVLDALSSGD